MQLPEVFDAGQYVRIWPDLAGLDPLAARDHYRKHGCNEGRRAHDLATRQDFIGLIPRDAPSLEIGPFCSPVLAGPNVSYFDVLSQTELRARARSLGIDEARVPRIDFVSVVRPGRSGPAVSPHNFATRNYQFADGRPVEWQSNGITVTGADYSVCQLNHYFVRSRAHWRDKMRRGYRDGTREDSDFALYDLNIVEDRLAARLAPRVRLRIDQTLARPPGLRPASPEAALLDPVWYFMRYPDVAASGLSASEHFWSHGLRENRDPNPFFDTAWYARTHLEPRGTKGPAFLHFLSEGAHDGLPARAKPL